MQHKWTSEEQQSRVCPAWKQVSYLFSDSFTSFTSRLLLFRQMHRKYYLFHEELCYKSEHASVSTVCENTKSTDFFLKDTEKWLKIRNHSTTGSLQHYDSLPTHSAQHWENEGNLWEPSMQRGRVRDAVTAHFTSVNTHSTQHALTDPLKLSLFLNLPSSVCVFQFYFNWDHV